jgi:hypothetical protein
VHGPHESLVNPPPIGAIPKPLLDFGTEIEMSHGLLHHIEAVERHREIEWRGVFDQFGPGGGDFVGHFPLQGPAVFTAFRARHGGSVVRDV